MATHRINGLRIPVRRLAWWPALMALWLLFVGQWTWQVAVWGAGLAGLATLGAVVVARHGLLGARGRWSWSRELLSAGWAVLVDFAIVTAVLAKAVAGRRRGRCGVFRRDVSAAGDGPRDAGRRAWVELVATWSPNCYVIDVSPETGSRLIHDMRRHRASEMPA